MGRITNYRKKIDKIDKRIIELLAKRFELSGKIGALKRKSNIKIVDKGREEAVISTILLNAEKCGLNKTVIENIYAIIIQESRKKQKAPEHTKE